MPFYMLKDMNVKVFKYNVIFIHLRYYIENITICNSLKRFKLCIYRFLYWRNMVKISRYKN